MIAAKEPSRRTIAAPHAPEGHRSYVVVARSREELRRFGDSWETTQEIRLRLPPRLRCACGRSFVGHAALVAHHLDGPVSR